MISEKEIEDALQKIEETAPQYATAKAESFQSQEWRKLSALCYILKRLARLLRIRSIGLRFNLRYALQTKVLRRQFRMKKDYVGN